MPNAGDVVTAYPSAVSADSPDNGTAVTVTTATANGATICGESFTAPPSGRVMAWVTVTFQALVQGTGQMYFGPQVRQGSVVGSGTVQWSPTQDLGSKVGQNIAGTVAGSAMNMISGLTPGAVYNVTAVYFGVGLGGTAPQQLSYFSRSCGVFPLD